MNIAQIAFKIMLVVFLSLLSISISILFYGYYIEKPYLTYENVPFEVVGNQFHAGDVVPIKVIRCVSAEGISNYTIAHLIQNARDRNINYFLPATVVPAMQGCITAVQTFNVLPLDIPAGEYRVIGSSKVDGRFRTHDVPWSSQEFNVE